MEVSSSSTIMGPPVHSSPELEHSMGMNNVYMDGTHAPNGPITNGVSAAAATSSQQPKIIQTAFIHKLYK